MKIRNFIFFSIFFFLFKLFFVFSFSNPYYQIIDKYSFNLKEKKASHIFYDNFNREGDVTFYDKFFMLTPRKNNTHGLIYTKGEINSENLELQIKFRIHNEKTSGSAFGIWFFKDKINNIGLSNNSYFGFKPDFNGIGVILYTPPKLTIEAKTFIYVEQNDGQVNKTGSGFNQVAAHNSCNENYHGRTVKLTIKFETSEKNIAIKFNNKEYLSYPCLDHVDIPNIKPPFRIGISSYNGIIDEQQFLDNVEIEKFTIFNQDEKLKLNNTNFIKDDAIINNNKLILNTTNDLIQNYSEFLEKFNNLKNHDHIQELNGKLDNSIKYLSEIKNNLENRENIENEKNINNLENVTGIFKEYVILLQDKFSNLKKQLSNIKIEKLDFVNNSSINTQIKQLSKLDYELFFREVDKLKKEWESNKVKHVLSHHLNIMLSEKIDDVINSLKSTEGMHSKMASQLNDKLRENSYYIGEKIETNYFTFCIVLGLVSGNILMLFWLYRKFNRYTKNVKNI